MGWSRPCSNPAAIEAGISRGVLIIIVSTAAMHAPFPTWVIFDRVFEIDPRVDVRFDPESDQDRTATQYVAMGQKATSALIK